MYQSLSELISLCKEDMGLRDLPKPVTDEDIYRRAVNSALKSFSLIYPYTSRIIIGEQERMCHRYPAAPQNRTNNYSNIYQIPREYWQEQTILWVNHVEIQRPNGYNDLYVPQGMAMDPASLMMGMASIQMMSAMARNMTHALTFEFRAPDVLMLFNGWTGGNYEVELALSHDPTLSTLPPGTYSSFRKLLLLDLEEYLYNKLKRVQSLDLGVGSVELKIDDWADAGRQKDDLLAEWGEASELDSAHIYYF